MNIFNKNCVIFILLIPFTILNLTPHAIAQSKPNIIKPNFKNPRVILNTPKDINAIDQIQKQQLAVTREVKIYGNLINGGNLGETDTNCSNLAVSVIEVNQNPHNQQLNETVLTRGYAIGSNVQSDCKYNLSIRQPFTTVSQPKSRLFIVRVKSPLISSRFLLQGESYHSESAHLASQKNIDLFVYRYSNQ